MATLQQLRWGLPLKPLPPPVKSRDPSVPHAPPLPLTLTAEQQKLAVRNALRYFPSSLHEELAPEFSLELIQYGHIYMYRFVPTFELRAYPIDSYPTKSRHAAAIILMILNNLDWSVAQFPHELITYGGNGQVFSNWAQFWITMKYLCELTNDQTLVMYSGHPLGLFPSISSGPRVVITNGMVVPNYSRREDYDRMFALGVSMYGQMTAGSYCYIGPQGIVHGTVLTILNAGRKYLGLEKMNRKVFVSSGLGGMSGAQAKAAVICGCIGVIAEVNITALKRRYDQGWLLEIIDDPDALISRIEEARRNNEVTSIGFWGNIVTLWERLVQKLEETGELLVDLGSDQTSCHNPFNGGYYPFQLSFEESQKVLRDDPGQFRQYVQESLRRQISAINKLSDAGMKFWDYGNAFLLEAERAGADVLVENNASSPKFRYPSYVQDIMGDIFSLGFGPFRWVCTSCDPQDLKVTDDIACGVLQSIHSSIASQKVKKQYEDNIHWIQQAAAQNLVVGSQARILYSDQTGRIQLALAFNDAVKAGKLKSPVVISRDHHDVSGTDSPYRETADINDGSSFTADMAVQNFVGDSFRGATWVALHNGGGVGWGEVINGGFGLLLDGTQDAAVKARQMLSWDVSNGVARRCWSGNGNAQEAITDAMKKEPRLQVTLPNHVIDEGIIESALKELCGVNNRM